jgi:hypothetical protein
VTPDPFAQLAELAREEHRLVLDGRFVELADLDRRRAAVLAVLPAVPPPAAEAHLRETARVQALVTVALHDALATTQREIAALDGRRTALRGYAAAAR